MLRLRHNCAMIQPTTSQRPFAILLYAAIIALGSAWMAVLAAQSPGTPLHDEVTHYFIARDSWENPVFILDVWGRPGNTLFYMLPSLISLGARRWWAVITCIIITLTVTRSAARLGLRQLWLIPLALYIQPWFLQLGFTSITQIPFMLALTLGIDQWITGRRGWASLLFGLLPLIRHEGLALTAVWIGYLCLLWMPFVSRFTRARRMRLSRSLLLALIALMPMMAWNVLHYAALGRLASGNLLEIRPTDIYGSGDWLHFLLPMVGSVGIIVFTLAMGGAACLWRERRAALIFTLPALFYFVTHTLIYRFGLFASGGYVLFLLPMAPTFALLAAFAAERVPSWIDKHLPQQMSARRRRAVKLTGVGALYGAALLYSGAAMLAVRPWQLQPNEIAAQQAADWLVANEHVATPVYSTHTWFFWVYEDRGNLIIAPGGSKLEPSEVPPGAFILWDLIYGNLNGIDLEVLRTTDSGFIEVQRFYQEQLILFRKVGGNS